MQRIHDNMFDSCFMPFKLDYSETKNIAVGDVVSSEDISAGEHIWRINCFPRGDDKADKGEYLSIFLELKSNFKDVKAIFEAFVLTRDGEPSCCADRCVQVYPPDGQKFYYWGWPQFVKRSDLESLYVTNGWVTIVCGIIVVRDDPLTVPPSDIGKHLGALLDRTDGTDVSFTVGGEAFHAHRAVLAARSPVFRVELLGSMAEATMPSITLHDIAPATFKVLIRFMYTDVLPADDELGDSSIEMFQHLLAAADRYALDRLKVMCAQKLWDNVAVDTVADILACAEMYSCPELKKKCIEFFAVEKNFRKAVLTEGFVMLVQKFPSIIFELREGVGTA